MGLLVDMGSKYDTKAKGDDTKEKKACCGNCSVTLLSFVFASNVKQMGANDMLQQRQSIISS